LFRLNRRGGFNVPAGRYAKPTICDAGHVRAVARVLAAPGVTLHCIGFEETIAGAGEGDFVYCDPPYAPVSRTASFAQYTPEGFGDGDQRRLQRAVIDAAGRGAVVLVSNSSAPEIERAYGSREAQRAGLRVARVPARRAINSRASARGPIEELIITNADRPTLRMAKAALRARGPHQLAAAGTRKRQSQV
jgi:DNA adenine methylase